jgi:hypothetical protein
LQRSNKYGGRLIAAPYLPVLSRREGVPANMVNTANEFVKSYAVLWGEDEVEYLLERGFEPIQITDGSEVKWVWRLTQDTACATLPSGGFYSRLNRSAD